MRFRAVPSTAVLVSALGLFVLSGCASAPPEPARRLAATDIGRLSFTVRQGFSSVTVNGNLRLPDSQGPFPAVVLLHGCAGVTRSEEGWVGALLGWNYATFVVDWSWLPRGLHPVLGPKRPDQKVARHHLPLAGSVRGDHRPLSSVWSQ